VCEDGDVAVASSGLLGPLVSWPVSHLMASNLNMSLGHI